MQLQVEMTIITKLWLIQKESRTLSKFVLGSATDVKKSLFLTHRQYVSRFQMQSYLVISFVDPTCSPIFLLWFHNEVKNFFILLDFDTY